MAKPNPIFPIALLFATMLDSNAFAYAQVKKASDPQSVSITVYGTMGVIRENRELDLEKGINNVNIEGVARTLEPGSVIFRALKNPDRVSVEEQNFQNDFLSPAQVLFKSIGKPVTLTRYFENGPTREIKGTLLYAEQGPEALSEHTVIKSGDQYFLGPKGQFQLESLPSGMVSKPSLFWVLDSEIAGKEDFEVTYLANSLSWHADYVANIDETDKNADLNGWVSIDNRTGSEFKHAKLELVAGDVRNVAPQRTHRGFIPGGPVDPRYGQSNEVGAVMAMARPMQMESSNFEEYHLYEVPKLVDLEDNQTKQISLFKIDSVPLQKKFIVDSSKPIVIENTPDGGTLESVQVNLEIKNDEQSHLGLPLPAGKISVYKRDHDRQLQFVGSDLIKHTPKGEIVRLHIGNATELVAERKQTSVQQVSKQVQKLNYEIDLRNHKDKEETITVVEHASGDWKINSSSHPYVKKNSTTFEFAIKVGANSEETLTYEIQTKSK